MMSSSSIEEASPIKDTGERTAEVEKLSTPQLWRRGMRVFTKSRFYGDLAARGGLGRLRRFRGAGSLCDHPSDFDRWDADAVRWAEEIVKAIDERRPGAR
jgi:hypothetical protein